VKSGSEVIEVNFEELAKLLERARQGPLGEEDYGRLEAAIRALRYLIETIGEKDTTISRLRALLAKPSTEKTSQVLEQAGLKTPPKNSSPPSANDKPKPGHGRNGAQDYGGARRMKIAHGSLKAGDCCPEC
jgi:transposase